jgi:hypothetical protein
LEYGEISAILKQNITIAKAGKVPESNGHISIPARLECVLRNHDGKRKNRPKHLNRFALFTLPWKWAFGQKMAIDPRVRFGQDMPQWEVN